MDSSAMKVKGYKEEKACVCAHPEECRGLTAAFVLLQDPRKGFVKLPKWKDDPDTQYYIERNQQRASYLRYLLPDHPPNLPTPSKNIALHHFHPKVTQRFLDKRQKEIPKTITDMEMQYLGMELHDADRVMDEYGFPTGEYIFVPNYPLNLVKEDLKRMILINRLFHKAVSEAREEQQEHLQQAHAQDVAADVQKLQEKQRPSSPASPSPLEKYAQGPEEARRRVLHSQLETWEHERRSDYAVLLESNSSTWKGSIDFLEEGVREIARAERLVLGAAMADKLFSEAMHAISHDSYMDDQGNAITDIRKQNKLMEVRQEEWMPTDMLGSVVEEKTRLGAKFSDNAKWGLSEIGHELSVFRQEMEAEVNGIAKMGDSLLKEMELSEKEVQTCWDALHAIVMSETKEAPILSPTGSHEEEEEEEEEKAEEEEEEEEKAEEEKAEERDVDAGASQGGEESLDGTEKNEEHQEVRTGPLFVRTPSGKQVVTDDEGEKASPDGGEKSSPSWASGGDVLSPLSTTDAIPRGRGFGLLKSLSGLSRQSISPADASSVISAASSTITSTFSPANSALRKISLVKDVWVRESLYRAAAQHQAKVWHTCMGLLAKMSDAVKEIELERSVKLHAMLLDFLPRERRLFIGLPAVPKPVIEKLMSYRTNEDKMEENIDEALHKRSRIVLRIDNDQRSSFMNRSRCKAPDLSGKMDKVPEGEAFETKMNRYAGVVERRVANKVFKCALAIVTADYYLHLFDIKDDDPNIAVGMSPEEAYDKLLPKHEFPTLEHWQPRTDKVLQDLTPAETINLMNSAVTAVDDHVEIVETVAGRIRDKATRKIVLKANDESSVWENVLRRRPQDETASEGLKAMLSV